MSKNKCDPGGYVGYWLTIGAGALLFGLAAYYSHDKPKQILKEFNKTYEQALVEHGDMNKDGLVSKLEQDEFDTKFGTYVLREHGVRFVSHGNFVDKEGKQIPLDKVTELLKKRYRLNNSGKDEKFNLDSFLWEKSLILARERTLRRVYDRYILDKNGHISKKERDRFDEKFRNYVLKRHNAKCVLGNKFVYGNGTKVPPGTVVDWFDMYKP